MLSFKKSPDYEKPKGGTADPLTSNTYTVMDEGHGRDPAGRFRDRHGQGDQRRRGDGKVTLSARRPQTDAEFTAEGQMTPTAA